MPAKANDVQVGGAHYRVMPVQHWDLCSLFKWDYFQGQIIKYVMRWRGKNGVEDLKKAQHVITKYIEEAEAGRIDRTPVEVQPREQWLALLGGVTAATPVPDGYVLVPRGMVKPTGWNGFTYEGDKDGKEWYRCLNCKEHLMVPIGDVPVCHNTTCSTEPGRNYVHQG